MSTFTKDRYLRNRPFLAIKVSHRPGAGANTCKKGWGDTPAAWASFEQPIVVDRVNAKLLIEAAVIIDILNAKAIKSDYANDSQEVVEHYLTKYRPQVREALDIWLTRTANKEAMRIVEQEIPVEAPATDAVAE